MKHLTPRDEHWIHDRILSKIGTQAERAETPEAPVAEAAPLRVEGESIEGKALRPG